MKEDSFKRSCYWANVYGCADSFILSKKSEVYDGLIVYIVSDGSELIRIKNELKFFNKNLNVLLFPSLETLPYDSFSPHQSIISERLLTLHKLSFMKKGILLVSVATLVQRLIPKDYFEMSNFILNKSDLINIGDFKKKLDQKGYLYVDQVLGCGEYTVRGSIIDIFSMGSFVPYRIDLYDNEVDEIYEFNPETQRSIRKVDKINLLLARECPLDEAGISRFKDNWEKMLGTDKSSLIYQNIIQGKLISGIEYYLPLFFTKLDTLFNYIKDNSLIIFKTKIKESLRVFWDEARERYEQLSFDVDRPILKPSQIFLPSGEFFSYLKNFDQVEINNHVNNRKKSIDKKIIRFRIKKIPDDFISGSESDSGKLRKISNFVEAQRGRVLFCADSVDQLDKFTNFLKKTATNIKFKKYLSVDIFMKDDHKFGIIIASFKRGLFFPKLLLFPVSLILQQKNRYYFHEKSNEESDQDQNAIINDLTELKIDDPVVHIEHGIGKYKGLKLLTINGKSDEYLTLEYKNEANLYVPISSLHLVNRYMGCNMGNISYSELGSDRWEKAKRKAIEKIRDTAAELLDIYAKRSIKKGFPFSFPKEDYEKFIEDFPFELTKDQKLAIDQVISDMTKDKIMDRLICGDVGFGKTEVAMRATFISAFNVKQVAILAPTTLLAKQHYDNFMERFSSWPFSIKLLSRFNSQREEREIVQELKNGKIDIVIGTHKLLQFDVKFKDLGLLIIDEEHRFGVNHKEKIKSMRSNVDVLTLTATPIPRTLSISFSKMKSLSIISTPPKGRLSVKTFIRQYEPSLIREAILRELTRGGQVYFVHNDISTIEDIVQELRILIPDVKVEFVHGQMKKRELEKVMNDFYHMRFNVLVCTTIIESGIDVPSANTIIINKADYFGLSQLHQLRGRVGRSCHQSYAYLLVNYPKERLKGDAKKRLEAIESMKNLGSGFILSIRDMEIRGSGEILGEQQSGQIQSIGYNLYIEFLNRAIQSLKVGNSFDAETLSSEQIEISLHVCALIPDSYVRDVHTRLTLYKRIAEAKSDNLLYDIESEIKDRFGLLPEQVKNLFSSARLRIKANKVGILKIKTSKNNISFEFNDRPKISVGKIIKLVQSHPKIYKFESANKLKVIINQDESIQKNLIDQIFFLIDEISENAC